MLKEASADGGAGASKNRLKGGNGFGGGFGGAGADGGIGSSGGGRNGVMSRVMDRTGRPIPGLYGAGNCIASPTANAYYGGGGTLGPAITFAYLAGRAAARSAEKELG